MNLPTLIGTVLVVGVFIAIIARAIYNKRHHKGGCGCGCGCESCGCVGACHQK